MCQHEQQRVVLRGSILAIHVVAKRLSLKREADPRVCAATCKWGRSPILLIH